MNKPICMCKYPYCTEMKLAEVGVDVRYVYANGGGEMISADVYQCPECGVRIVAAFAQGPFARAFEEGYANRAAESWRRGNQVIVKERV